MLTFFGSTLISFFFSYYEKQTIPDYIANTIKYNLESTPIMDILSDNECLNGDTSNILGYYYGYNEGFKYGEKSYSEDFREKICTSSYENHCFKINAQKIIPYRIFKGKRLCTSKRPNKNYFDYLKSTIKSYGYCPSGQKKCGMLDKKRYLCLKNEESCPINDIVYNNESEYINQNIKYKTIKITENEYMHYTNEDINNFIITNLSFISGSGKGYPCGANDNTKFMVYSLIENNYNCQGYDTNYIYYFYKNLSTITLEQFYKENDIHLDDLPEYKNLSRLGYMTVFSTGFFSLSDEDIKKFDNSPSRLEINNKNSKTISVCSFICFVSIIVLGGYSFFGISMGFSLGNTLTKIIVLSIQIFITLIITICGLIEFTLGKNTFKISSEVPKFFVKYTDKMENISGSAHFWSAFIFLIYQIPFLICLCIKYRKERMLKDPPLIKTIEVNTYPNNPNYDNFQQGPTDQFYNSSDFNYKPQSQEKDCPPPPLNNNGYQFYGQTPSYNIGQTIN